LKWFMARLGPARDMDVFRSDIWAPLAHYFEGDQTISALGDLADRRRAEEYSRVREALNSQRYTRLLLRLGRWIEQRGWEASAGKKIRRFRRLPVTSHAEAVLATRHERLRGAGHGIEKLSAPDLHRLRIQVKKQRYAAEFFRSLFPARRSAGYEKALRSLQDSLGYLNDAAVAERLVDDLTANAPHEDANTCNARIGAAKLLGWHGCEVASHRQMVFDSWHKFGRRKKFWN